MAAVGIDIGGTNIKAGIVDEAGNELVRHASPTLAAGKDALLAQVQAVVRELSHMAEERGLHLAGIGIGTAGYVNYDGVVGEATGNLPGWSGTNLRAELASLAGRAVFVDNDVNMMARGEAWRGAAQSAGNLICLTLGTGIGGCRMLNGVLDRGAFGYAGAYGHMTIQMDGLPCTCGLQGCWEAYASVTGLKRMIARMDTGQGTAGTTPAALFELARNGYAPAAVVVDRYARYVSAGLSSLIHIYNPSRIVIGGAIAAQGDFLFDRIRFHVQSSSLGVFRSALEIVPAALGDYAGMIGAAKIALDGGTH